MSGTPVSHRLMILSLAAVFVLTVVPARVNWAEEPKPGSALPIDRCLMQRLSNFTLEDVTSGRSTTLYGYQGRKAIVLVFLGNDCPVGNLYVPRLVELNREFRKKGVVFLGINSNAHETAQDVAKYRRGAWASIFRS